MKLLYASTAIALATAAYAADTIAEQIGGKWVGWDKITTIFSLYVSL